MLKEHKDAELAPRDIVSRAIYREQKRSRVYLDARKLGRGFTKRFPGIFALCAARGIDPRKDLIPVTPAAHYMMGGIVTDLKGHSSAPRLYAVGEVARTGVHGANRLASNSLLEGLVFAERVARDLANVAPLKSVPASKQWQVPPLADRGAAHVAAERIRSVMWQHVAITRTAKGLRTALAELTEIEQRLPTGATEETNLVQTARLITEAALLRKESRGGHYRSDFPRAKSVWRGRHIEM
jgi:L-aspartate oxidase